MLVCVNSELFVAVPEVSTFKEICFPPYLPRFKRLYDDLRGMKTEIEHVQHLLQKSKVQLQREFEEWWRQTRTPSGSTPPREAWYTPPPAPALPTNSSAHSQESSRHRPHRHQAAIAAQHAHLQGSAGQPPTSPPKPPSKYGGHSLLQGSEGQAPPSPPTRPPSKHRGRSPNPRTLNPVENRPPTGDTPQYTKPPGANSLQRSGKRRKRPGEDVRALTELEGAAKQGSLLYRKSWQPADALSPPQQVPSPPKQSLVRESERSVSSGGGQYLSERKQLFPPGKGFDGLAR